MDGSTVLATILWAGFAVGVGFGVAALVLRPDAPALACAVASVVLLGAFSFLAGFSIGPFTAAIPAALTGLAATRRRRADSRAAAVLVGLAAYLATVWLSPRDYGLVLLPPLELLALIASAIPSSRSSSRSSAAP